MLRRTYDISVAMESAFAERAVKEFPVYLQCTKVGFSDSSQLTRTPPAYLPHVFVIFQQIFINDLLTKIIFSPIPLLLLYPLGLHYVYGVSDRRKTPRYPLPAASAPDTHSRFAFTQRTVDRKTRKRASHSTNPSLAKLFNSRVRHHPRPHSSFAPSENVFTGNLLSDAHII